MNLKRRQFVGNEEIAFADEQKQNAHEEIAFADEQKRNAREEIAFPDCGRGAKEVLLPPSLECTSGIRFNRPNWQNCCIRHRRRGVRSFVYVPIPGLGSGSSTAWADRTAAEMGAADLARLAILNL